MLRAFTFLFSLLLFTNAVYSRALPDHGHSSTEGLPAFGPGFNYCGSKCQLGLLTNCVASVSKTGISQFDCICTSQNYVLGMDDCLDSCNNNSVQRNLILRYRALICNPAVQDKEFETFWEGMDLIRPTVQGAIPKVTRTFTVIVQPSTSASPTRTSSSSTSSSAETTTSGILTDPDVEPTEESTSDRNLSPTESSSAANSDNQNSTNSRDTPPNIPLIAGISVGAFLFLLLILAFIIFFLRKRKREDPDRNISPSRATSVWGGSVTFDSPIFEKPGPPPRPPSPKTIAARHPSGFPYPPPARPLPIPTRLSTAPSSARPILYSPEPMGRNISPSSPNAAPTSAVSAQSIEAFLMPPPLNVQRQRPESSASFETGDESGPGVPTRPALSMRVQVGSYYSTAPRSMAWQETETESDAESEDSFSSWDGNYRPVRGTGMGIAR